jgi:flavin-dependent dehydrogenase
VDLDVAVVGASSAGLFAAERLARAGRRVAVFERQPAVGHARRTYIITPQIARVLGEVPPSAVLHRSPVLELIAPGAAAAVELREPDLIVERRELCARLAERAAAAGAELYFGHRLADLAAGPRGAELRLARRGAPPATARAAAVIGADGVFSDVAQAAGIARPPVVQIVQAEVALPPGYDPRVTKVWFEPAETRYFYWLIPESDERGVLGVIADAGDPARARLDAFVARQGLRPLAYQAATVAMHHPALRPWGALGRAPVFLVGDAAGQVKVTTVGGSVTGFYGAEAAVRCLTEGLSPRRALAGVARELDLHWWLRRLLERLDGPGYARLVRQLSPAVLGFLGRHNRDEMAGAIWQVPFLRPQLLGTALDALVRPGPRPPVLRPGPAQGPAVAPEGSSTD